MSTAIQMVHVKKIIHGREILKDVTLSIAERGIVGFVGANGSGKSTIFRIIAGLVKPTSGEVFVFGKKLHKDLSFPKNTSVVFEKPGFLEQYSGFDNLKFLADIQRKINDQQIITAIQRVGLDPYDKRPVKAYSQGMKQKLAIAQAIMEEPDLILLDEATNGLDEKSVDQLFRIVREEHERGATLLITSHHKADIDTLCNEVYRVHEGVVEKIM